MKIRFGLWLAVLFVFGFCGSLWSKEAVSQPPSPSLSYVKSTDAYKRIKAAIDKIRVVDSHEHLRPEKDVLKNGPPDFFKVFVSSYVRSDIQNIGNTFARDERYMNESLSVEERWESFAPIYERLKNTGYIRCTRTGIEKVHNIKIKDAESIKRINKSLSELYKPGFYKKALCDIGNIECVLVYAKFPDGFKKEGYPEFFRGVRAFEELVVFTSQEDIYNMERRYGVLIHSVDDLDKVYRKYVDESILSGVVGFKYTGAYLRSLDFSEYSREKADALLKKLLRLTEPKWSWVGGEAFSIEEGKALSNYCMDMMLRIIEEKKMPLSVHTGLLTNGQNDIRNSNPQLLIPLFKEYKGINFDLFHGGWPYVTEFIELGKSWPNVYLNQCWTHIISPEGARAQLSEMLECVPVNKIFAFGGDCQYPEQAVGHLEIAKENCAIVLAEKVLNGSFTEEEAIGYAQRILRTNSIEFFKLNIPEK